MNAILALPLDELHAKLETATSDELRSLRAHVGLGKAGTKEANKTLIYKHVQHRRLTIAKQSQDEELDDEFADVGCSVTPINTDVGITFVDPFVKDYPWRSHAAKVQRLAA